MVQNLKKKQYQNLKQCKVNLVTRVEKALRKRKLKKASIVSSDNYIIDGHHGWRHLIQDKT